MSENQRELDYLYKVNQMMKYFDIKQKITKLSQIKPHHFITLFQYLFPSHCQTENITTKNSTKLLDLYLDKLSLEIVKTDLGHLNAKDIEKGNLTQIAYLIDILEFFMDSFMKQKTNDEQKQEINKEQEENKEKKYKEFIDDLPTEKRVQIEEDKEKVTELKEPGPKEEVLNRIKEMKHALTAPKQFKSFMPVQNDKAKSLVTADNLIEAIQLVLPDAPIPEWIQNQIYIQKYKDWENHLNSVRRDSKLSLIQKDKKIESFIMEIQQLLKRGHDEILKMEKQELMKQFKSSVFHYENKLKDKKIHQVRMQKYQMEAERRVLGYQLRRRDREEKLMREMIKNYQKLEKEQILFDKRLQKEERNEEIKNKRLKLESKKQYIQDQIEMMKEKYKELKNQEKQEKVEERFIQSQKRKEEKELLRKEIELRQQKLETDGRDFYFREMDVERVFKK